MSGSKTIDLDTITKGVKRQDFAQGGNPLQRYLVLYRLKAETRDGRTYDDRRDELIARIHGLQNVSRQHYSTSAWIVYCHFGPDNLAENILGPAIDAEVDALSIVPTKEKITHFGADLDLES